MRKIISLDKPPIINKRGGKRDGAGRKHKYGEETQRISIPISLIPQIMAMLETHKKD